MKLCFGRIALATLVTMALVGGPAIAQELDIPTVNAVGAKPSTVRLQVQAGPSGAQQGFTAQWMKKADFDALGGWPTEPNAAVMSGDFVGVPVWTTDGNSEDYSLAPQQWMAIELGQLFDETGVAATSTEELQAGTQYVVRVYARGGGGFAASQPTADAVVSTMTAAQNCTYTQGYWKNHAGAWPVLSLTLGTVTYNQAQLLSILNEPSGGNGLIILAHQLIAAKLNLANGASPSFISPTIAAADAQIGSLVIPPVGAGSLPSSTTSANSHTLDDWNNGITGPGHCGSTPARAATWGSLKGLYR
ncbi:MAG: hypothetical protein ABI960_02705 [Candidatus Eisenbacteria bacterium]